MIYPSGIEKNMSDVDTDLIKCADGRNENNCIGSVKVGLGINKSAE